MADVTHAARIGGRTLPELESAFEEFLVRHALDVADPAHDIQHVRRVVSNAVALAHSENADLTIVVPAAWLHDCVHVPKHSPDRARASRLAADAAGSFLRDLNFPDEKISEVEHAIHAHSYSADVAPQSLEAKVVQDADRLDALGAIGTARTLLLGGTMGSELYDAADPFARDRNLNDREFVVDHFFIKLFKLSERMQTPSGREEAERRTAFMRRFLAQLAREIGSEAAGKSLAGSDG